MQMQTERGLVSIRNVFDSVEDAKEEGYSYAFRSCKLGRELYSKCTDDKGLHHAFALINGR